MRMKRGTDHSWKVVRYKTDMFLYAKCKCGFEYNCGSTYHNEGITRLYRYCPSCGARKKWYNDVPEKIDDVMAEEVDA